MLLNHNATLNIQMCANYLYIEQEKKVPVCVYLDASLAQFRSEFERNGLG